MRQAPARRSSSHPLLAHEARRTRSARAHARTASGRLGGDEFALWIDAGDEAAAQRAAAALVSEVGARLPGDGELPAVTLSVGVAPTAGGARELTALLQAADTALYAAKDAGRARAALAD